MGSRFLFRSLLFEKYFILLQIIKELSLTPPNLLKEGMKILEDGISRVSCDRRLFLGLSAVFGALIISALFVEQHYPGITYAVGTFCRFFFTYF